MRMRQRLKLLLGYDGSACGDAALCDLQRAGLPAEVEALVLSVADVFLPPILPPGSDSLDLPTIVSLQATHPHVLHALEEAQALAQRAVERLRTLFPAWQVRAEAAADAPAWALIKKADAWQPDLIVVGSHGRSALGRLILGSVSQKVLAHARCSVRVARGRSDASTAPVRLILGVDGSPQAEAAVQVVAERHWPESSEALVIMALEPLKVIPALRWQASADEERAWAHRIVEAAAQTLRAAGLAVSTLIEAGDPKALLPREAERWQADAIFVGASGVRGIDRFLLGSVSAAVAARAPCSVEVVRPTPAR
jgi:nucleotide-binding universal stress UspA family protein